MCVYAMTFIIVILCIATVEAISWAYSLYSHCSWAIKNSIKDKRVRVPYSSLSVYSALSGIMSLTVWCAFIFVTTVTTLLPNCIFVLFFLVLFFQMITIHSWYVVSMYVCVPFEYIPFISKNIITGLNILMRGKSKINYVSLKEWYDIFSPAKDKNLLINFLDVIPDMVWTKDFENKYTYVNNAMCSTVLLKSKENVIGKTSMEIAKEHKEDGIVYTFGELCIDSDLKTRAYNKISVFYEYGLVNNKLLSLRVIKCPIYDEENNVVGIIGAARDITLHTISFDNIEQLIKKGNIEEAAAAFILYKAKFETFNNYKDLDKLLEDIKKHVQTTEKS